MTECDTRTGGVLRGWGPEGRRWGPEPALPGGAEDGVLRQTEAKSARCSKITLADLVPEQPRQKPQR